MADRKPLPVIYFNGEWMEANATLMEALKPGRLRGEGVFETVAVENGRLCFWPDHYARLARGLRAHGLGCRFGRPALQRLAEEAVRRNGLRRARVRVARYRDMKQNYLVIVAAAVPPAPAAGQPLSVQVSPFRRQKDRRSHLKNLTYQPFYDAHCHAAAQGYDEALLLDPQGHIVEGATANVFFIRREILHTPATAVGCLNGIVRGKVIGLAAQHGLRVKRGVYGLVDLKKADEVFMTNSLIGIRPVAALDGRPVSPRAEFTRRLRDAYLRLIQSETAG